MMDQETVNRAPSCIAHESTDDREIEVEVIIDQNAVQNSKIVCNTPSKLLLSSASYLSSPTSSASSSCSPTLAKFMKQKPMNDQLNNDDSFTTITKANLLSENTSNTNISILLNQSPAISTTSSIMSSPHSSVSATLHQTKSSTTTSIFRSESNASEKKITYCTNYESHYWRLV
jgi:hypothetical protein